MMNLLMKHWWDLSVSSLRTSEKCGNVTSDPSRGSSLGSWDLPPGRLGRPLFVPPWDPPQGGYPGEGQFDPLGPKKSAVSSLLEGRTMSKWSCFWTIFLTSTAKKMSSEAILRSARGWLLEWIHAHLLVYSSPFRETLRRERQVSFQKTIIMSIKTIPITEWTS